MTTSSVWETTIFGSFLCFFFFGFWKKIKNRLGLLGSILNRTVLFLFGSLLFLTENRRKKICSWFSFEENIWNQNLQKRSVMVHVRFLTPTPPPMRFKRSFVYIFSYITQHNHYVTLIWMKILLFLKIVSFLCIVVVVVIDNGKVE